MPQQLRALRPGWLIYIHHHQHRIAARHLYRLLALDDHIILILRVVCEQIHQRLYRRTGLVQHNVAFPA